MQKILTSYKKGKNILQFAPVTQVHRRSEMCY